MAARFFDVSGSEIDQYFFFSQIIINVIILKQLVASGDVNIGEWSPRLRLGDYSPIFTSPSATSC